MSDESKKIPANGSIIPFVTFPGQEIKDLYVHESPEAAPAPQPAARKQENKSQNKPQQSAPRNQNSNDNRGQQQNQRQNQQQQHQSAPRQAAQPTQRREQAPRQQNEPRTSNAGTGAHLLHLREKKAGEGSIQTPTDSVFDFEAGLNIFKKEEVLLKVATDDGAHEVVKEVKYKKDDFFDMLSTDRQSREEGQAARLTGAQERSLNQDTFGAIALQGGGGYRRNNYNNRSSGNGYNNNGNNNNGGGYGRGRGRGRGGGRGTATN